jgi:hypothetical protein
MPTAGSARAAVASAGHAVKSLLSSGVQAIQAVDRAIDKAIDQSAKVGRALGPLGMSIAGVTIPRDRLAALGVQVRFGCCFRGQRQLSAVGAGHRATVDVGHAHAAAVVAAP